MIELVLGESLIDLAIIENWGIRATFCAPGLGPNVPILTRKKGVSKGVPANSLGILALQILECRAHITI